MDLKWVRTVLAPGLQGFGYLLGAPVSGERHHRLDSVGLARFTGCAVRAAQLGRLVGGELAVTQADKDNASQLLPPTSLEKTSEESGM